MTYEEKDYRIFELFRNHWALVTAGSMEKHNACTVAWGSMGTLWTRPGKSGSVITVYLYPTRYTCELMTDSETFTVSFFPESRKKALAYMGSYSGRDGDKTASAGLTPVPMGESVTYAEADLTFLCRKICQHRLAKEEIAQDIQDYYAANPKVYPAVENGEWQPHCVFIGEIIDVEDNE